MPNGRCPTSREGTSRPVVLELSTLTAWPVNMLLLFVLFLQCDWKQYYVSSYTFLFLETATPRQGNMHTLSKDGLSNGVPSSRQAEFS